MDSQHHCALIDAMANAGIRPATPLQMVDDGDIHRFRVEGDKPDSLNGWYAIHHDQHTYACFGCWKRDISTYWIADRAVQSDPQTRRTIEARIQTINQQHAQQRAAKMASASERAKQRWQLAQPLRGDEHAYLKAKGVQSHGVKQLGQSLVVPLVDYNRELVNVQFIDASGKKRFQKDGRKKGCYHLIGAVRSCLYIVEGYATGATVHEATGQAVAVAFDAGNLLPVAKTLKSLYPDATLVIAADNDHHRPDNPGLTKARVVARTVKAEVVYPSFEPDSDATDWNDYGTLYGLDATREALSPTIKVQSVPKGDEAEDLPVGFSFHQGQLMYQNPDNENASSVWVCSALHVLARTRDERHQNHGYLLRFKDVDGHVQQWAMPAEMLAGDGADYRRVLLNMGLALSTGKHARSLLSSYIQNCRPSPRAKCVDRVGWHDDVYVLPDTVVGDSKEQILLQTATLTHRHYQQRGTLEQWQQYIAALCVGNSRLVLALSAAFAPILMKPSNTSGFGIHFYGPSSVGKTTALKLASTVWGEPQRVQTWRTTANALEGTAAAFNHGLLCLDEIHEISAKELSSAVYMLANGQGKSRMTKAIEMRDSNYWNLLFLSSGELSLADHLCAVGERNYAGQEVRVIGLPADVGQGKGLFECLHDQGCGAQLSRQLLQACERYHGVAARCFIKQVVKDKAATLALCDEIACRFVEQLQLHHPSGQTCRVAKQFGMIAAAGELATHWQITGWPRGESLRAAEYCFRIWLKHRGGEGALEDKQAIRQVALFFQRYGQSRFADWRSDPVMTVHNRAGFLKPEEQSDTSFVVFRNVFESEICQGIDSKRVLKLLKQSDLLMAQHSAKAHTVVLRPPKGRQGRFYQIKSSVIHAESIIFGEEDDDECSSTVRAV